MPTPKRKIIIVPNPPFYPASSGCIHQCPIWTKERKLIIQHKNDKEAVPDICCSAGRQCCYFCEWDEDCICPIIEEYSPLINRFRHDHFIED